jgi:hypothetical protein
MITQKDAAIVEKLSQFFLKTEANERHIHAAMKQLKEMRRASKKSAV